MSLLTGAFFMPLGGSVSEFIIHPKVKPTGELPPKILSWLDQRYVNHDEFTKDTATRVSVSDYGAVAGGSSSQSSAFQSAIDTAATFGVPVSVPEGVFTMGTALKLHTNTKLQLSKGTVLDFSASSASFYMDVRGSASSPISYTGVVTAGARSIPLSGHGMVAGDWCLIRSADVFDPDSTSTCHGELLQVSKVEAGTVHFLTPVCDTYTTTVTVTPVTMCTGVEISGGTIRGNYIGGNGKGGLRAQYTDGLRLDHVRFEGIDAYHVSIRDSVDALAFDCEFDWAVSTATGYGISFADATRDSACLFSTFRGVRHSLSTNNTAGAGVGGVVRRILFAFNTVEWTSTALGGSMGGGDAIDTHTAAEDIWVRGNTVNGSSGQGINMECASGVIEDNTVTGCASVGISFHNESRRPGRVRIMGNTVRSCGSTGIYTRTGGRGTTTPTESMIVTGNHVEDVAGYGIQAGYALTERGTVVTGNTIIRAAGFPLRLVRLDGVVAHSNVIIGGAARGIDYNTISHGVLGPDAVSADAPTEQWTGLVLNSVTNSTLTPGAVSVAAPGGVGVNIGSSCANIALGPTAHLDAQTPLINNGPTTVRSY